MKPEVDERLYTGQVVIVKVTIVMKSSIKTTRAVLGQIFEQKLFFIN